MKLINDGIIKVDSQVREFLFPNFPKAILVQLVWAAYWIKFQQLLEGENQPSQKYLPGCGSESLLNNSNLCSVCAREEWWRSGWKNLLPLSQSTGITLKAAVLWRSSFKQGYFCVCWISVFQHFSRKIVNFLISYSSKHLHGRKRQRVKTGWEQKKSGNRSKNLLHLLKNWSMTLI